MQRYREKHKSVTLSPESVTSEGALQSSVTRDGVALPRFVTLSDGQVLDRAKSVEPLPQSGGFIARMRAANKGDATIIDSDRAERYRLWREDNTSSIHPVVEAIANKKERDKLRLICSSLDKKNLGAKVYYGTGGLTMDTVSDLLDAVG